LGYSAYFSALFPVLQGTLAPTGLPRTSHQNAWIAVTHLDEEKYQELITDRNNKRLIAQ
jgi:hypothetical protein